LGDLTRIFQVNYQHLGIVNTKIKVKLPIFPDFVKI